MRLTVKEKVLGCIGFLSMMFASGEVTIPGWTGILIQALWSFSLMGIAYVCFIKLEQIERKERNEQRRIAKGHR